MPDDAPLVPPVGGGAVVCVLRRPQVLRTLQCARRHLESAGAHHAGHKDALVETVYLTARTYGALPSPSQEVVALRDSAAAAFLALRVGC